MGVKTIAVATDSEKLNICKSFGAKYVICYNDIGENSQSVFSDKVTYFTRKRGPDYVLDPLCALNTHQHLPFIRQKCKWLFYYYTGGYNMGDIGHHLVP